MLFVVTEADGSVVTGAGNAGDTGAEDLPLPEGGRGAGARLAPLFLTALPSGGCLVRLTRLTWLTWLTRLTYLAVVPRGRCGRGLIPVGLGLIGRRRSKRRSERGRRPK